MSSLSFFINAKSALADHSVWYDIHWMQKLTKELKLVFEPPSQHNAREKWETPAKKGWKLYNFFFVKENILQLTALIPPRSFTLPEAQSTNAQAHVTPYGNIRKLSGLFQLFFFRQEQWTLCYDSIKNFHVSFTLSGLTDACFFILLQTHMCLWYKHLSSLLFLFLIMRRVSRLRPWVWECSWNSFFEEFLERDVLSTCSQIKILK